MTPYSDTDLEHDLRAAIDAGDPALIGSLGALMDRRDTNRPPTPSLHAAALWYAGQGMRVFPLQPGHATRVNRDTGELEALGKHPYPGSRGCKDATTDVEQINDWWTARPDSNIGLATGHLVDVIDIDGPAGVESIVSIYDTLPPILGKVSTPRAGGTHLYVHAVDGRGNRARLLPGVDYRGLGGYVVAPPSVNVDGVPYVWRAPLDVAAVVGSGVAA